MPGGKQVKTKKKNIPAPHRVKITFAEGICFRARKKNRAAEKLRTTLRKKIRRSRIRTWEPQMPV